MNPLMQQIQMGVASQQRLLELHIAHVARLELEAALQHARKHSTTPVCDEIRQRHLTVCARIEGLGTAELSTTDEGAA